MTESCALPERPSCRAKAGRLWVPCLLRSASGSARDCRVFRAGVWEPPPAEPRQAAGRAAPEELMCGAGLAREVLAAADAKAEEVVKGCWRHCRPTETARLPRAQTCSAFKVALCSSKSACLARSLENQLTGSIPEYLKSEYAQYRNWAIVQSLEACYQLPGLSLTDSATSNTGGQVPD